MKRIVAVPGDTVRYGSCNVFVITASGERLNDSEPTMACRDAGAPNEVLLPDGMYFVAGDNRGNSLDSRVFGPISKSQINAKVLAQMRFTWAP